MNVKQLREWLAGLSDVSGLDNAPVQFAVDPFESKVYELKPFSIRRACDRNLEDKGCVTFTVEEETVRVDG